QAGKAFAAVLHQGAEVLHVFDTVLGGAGHTLKLFAELLLLRKALGFSKHINEAFLTPLRQTEQQFKKTGDAATAFASTSAAAAIRVAGGSPAIAVPLSTPAWRRGDVEKQLIADVTAATAAKTAAKTAEAEAHTQTSEAASQEAQAQAEL